MRRALRARPLVLLIGLAVAGSSYFLFTHLKTELAPFEDQGTVVGIFVAPEGATIDYTDDYARQLEAIYAKEPDVARYFVVSGFPVVTQGISFIKTPPWDERERSQQDVARSLAPKMFAVPGVLAFPINPPPLGQSVRDKPVQFVIQTSRPYRELEQMVDAVMAKAGEFPGPRQPGDRSQTEQAAAQGLRRSGQGGRRGRRHRGSRPDHGDPVGRSPGDPVQAGG